MSRSSCRRTSSYRTASEYQSASDYQTTSDYPTAAVQGNHHPSVDDLFLSRLESSRFMFVSDLNECKHQIRQFWRDPIPRLQERAPFACFVWLFYALVLCGLRPETYQDCWTIMAPLKAISEQDPRQAFFEYLWCYMCWAHVYQATFDGLTWALNDTLLQVKTSLPPHTGPLYKAWVFIPHFTDLALDLVLRPILLLYVIREMGQLQSFMVPGAESSVYAGILLHGLQNLLVKAERVVYIKTGKRIFITLFSLAGAVLIILDHKGYNDATDASIGRAWNSAKDFDDRGQFN